MPEPRRGGITHPWVLTHGYANQWRDAVATTGRHCRQRRDASQRRRDAVATPTGGHKPPTAGRRRYRATAGRRRHIRQRNACGDSRAVGSSCVRRLRRCLLFNHKFQLFMSLRYAEAWEKRALNDRMSACTRFRSLSRLMDKGNAAHFFFMLSPNQRPCTVWRLRRQA